MLKQLSTKWLKLLQIQSEPNHHHNFSLQSSLLLMAFLRQQLSHCYCIQVCPDFLHPLRGCSTCRLTYPDRAWMLQGSKGSLGRALASTLVYSRSNYKTTITNRVSEVAEQTESTPSPQPQHPPPTNRNELISSTTCTSQNC